MTSSLVDLPEAEFRRIIGLCHSITDTTYALSTAELRVARSSEAVPDGVVFCDEEHFNRVRATLREDYPQRRSTAPGGPISNSLFSAAGRLGSYPRQVQVIWSGPIANDGSHDGHAPLDSLRTVGVRVDGYTDRNGGNCESICVISVDTGETEGIYVGPRPLHRTYLPEVHSGDLIMVMVRELEEVSERLGERTGYGVAVVMADATELAGASLNALQHLAGQSALRFLFGKMEDLKRLGIVHPSESTIPRWLESCEVILTDASNPVQVFPRGQLDATSLQVSRMPAADRSLLGAGDAYAGAYVSARITGQSIEEAHRIGVSESRLTSYSPTARRTFESNLTSVFGKIIGRSSDADDWEVSQVVRQNCGLSIISCGNVGVDEMALREATRVGLSATAVMPAGRRREGPVACEESWRIIELGSDSFRYCTWANVYVSDATILIDVGGGEGSRETRKAANMLERPILEVQINNVDRSEIADFIARHAVRILNIAGSRLSNIPLDKREAAELTIRNVVQGATRPFVTDNAPSSSGLIAGDGVGLIGIPRLSEVSDFMKPALEQHVNFGECTRSFFWPSSESGAFHGVVRAKSIDLVRMVHAGNLDAAFVGRDIVEEFGRGHFTIWGNLGVFNTLVAVTARDAALFAPWAIAAQYPNLAEDHFRGYEPDIVRVDGAGEGWVSSGEFDGLVDTWRTGLTSAANGLTFVEGVKSTALCLIIGDRPLPDSLAIAGEIWKYCQFGEES